MKKFFTLIVLHFILLTSAQPGTIDTTFNTSDIGFGSGDGANNIIRATIIQPDGKIIIAGDFTSFNSTRITGITRLNTDGTIDTTFNSGSGTSSPVYSIVLQPDGKILIGGFFYSYNGTPCGRIARLNSDGNIDTTFNTGTAANLPIESIALQTDGKIVIGGQFTSYKGTPRNRIARLNTDGTLDISFDPGSGVNNIVKSIASQPDGKIVIVGQFTTYNGMLQNRIARINTDGTLDTDFNIGTGASNDIYTVLLQSDGKILIGGQFGKYNNIVSRFFTRLNSNGSLDLSFNTGEGFDNIVLSIIQQPDDKILVGGAFTNYNKNTRNNVTRLNTDGSIDNSFNSSNWNLSLVYSLALTAEQKVLLSGNFSYFNINTFRKTLALLNKDGSLDTSFNKNTGANGEIKSVAIQSDGKILIGGSFLYFNDVKRLYLARLNTDGSLDLSFNQGKGIEGDVFSIVIQPDGKIIVAGKFLKYNDIWKPNIIRLNTDGSLDESFNSGNGTAYLWISSVALQADGKIIIGGYFPKYNDTPRNNIARLNSDGSLDTSFDVGTGANEWVKSVTIQFNGKILIGGYFTSYNGITRNRIARLNIDGSLDLSFDAGTGANSGINSIVYQTDGKILAGGSFTKFNEIENKGIVRLNNDGSIDTSFNSGTGTDRSIYAITLLSNNKILIGGNFTTYNDFSLLHIACLNTDGSVDESFEQGEGFYSIEEYDFGNSNVVNSFAIQSDGMIVAGGGFASYDGIGKNRIARINGGVALKTNNNEITKSIKLYPNPVLDILNISNTEGNNLEIKIYDSLGRCVSNVSVKNKKVNVSFLPSGIYIINVIEGNNVSKAQFIKK